MDILFFLVVWFLLGIWSARYVLRDLHSENADVIGDSGLAVFLTALGAISAITVVMVHSVKWLSTHDIFGGRK